MSISGITSYGQLSQVSSVSGLEQYWNNDYSTTSSVSSSKSDSSSMSQMGQMMSQLMQLSSTDTEKFKEVAQQIADDLAEQAESATTIGQSTMLTQMSANFATAAQSGSMESLKPQGPPPPPPSESSSGSGGGDAFSAISDAIAESLSNAGISSESSASYTGGDQMKVLMDELTKLQESDPAAFKEVAAQIAEQLSSQSELSSDSGESSMLADMSTRFTEAAQSGSMDSLAPQGSPPPPPPPSASGSSSESTQYSSSTTASSNQELFAMLQNLMGSTSSSLTDATSWSSFLAAQNAYQTSL
ncbi:MAG: hypothetical protein FD177_2626 [Desulfovibrionaceae bacterium]|nr:MAG: hypothetical protein FD177_2626 [Desulfovibrionaceae bacterium]